MPTVPEFRSIITNDEVSGFRITIPAKRWWGMTALLVLWLGGWAVGGVAVGMDLVTGRTKAPWGFLWLAGLTGVGLLPLFAVFWNMSGREIILINDQDLVVRRELGGFHLWEWGFALAAVRNLRYSPPIYDPFSFSEPWAYQLQWLGIGGGSVAFDYDGKTYRFGCGLSEVESRRLIKTVREYFKIEDDQDEGLPVLS